MRVLEVLVSILLDPAAAPLLRKFASTVTTKWLLVFLNHNTPPRAVVLCLRLINRLLATQGTVYISKFRNTADGFRAMRFQVPAFWDIAGVQTSLLSILCGVNPSAVPDSDFDPSRLLDVVRRPSEISSSILSVVFASLRVAIKELSKPSKNTQPAEETPGSVGPTVLTLQVVEFLRTLANSHPGYASLFAVPEHRTELIAVLLRVMTTPSKTNDESSVPSSSPFPILKRHLGYRVPSSGSGSDPNLRVAIPIGSSASPLSPVSPLAASPATISSQTSIGSGDLSSDPALSSIVEGVLSLLSIPIVEWAKASESKTKLSSVDDVLTPLFECISSSEAPVQVSQNVPVPEC
jgi:hypothetical protein